MGFDRSAPRRPVNLSLNSDLVERCKSEVGNLSAHVEALLAADLEKRAAAAEAEQRRTERALIRDYAAMLDEVLEKLTPENHAVAVGLAAIPEKIRGFGHVKMRHLATAKAEEAALFARFRAEPGVFLRAAE